MQVKKLLIEIEPRGSAFVEGGQEGGGELGRILRELSVHAYIGAASVGEMEGVGCVGLRDINGNKVGAAHYIQDPKDELSKPRRLRGHTLVIGGEWVTLWPVELAGEGTYPPEGCTEPLVWFHHSESDWSEPCDIGSSALVNRWGWAYASQDVSEAIQAAGGLTIDLKRRDREALMVCGNDNSETIRMTNALHY